MAELGVGPPTDLYPKPPQPQSQGALSDPTKMLDLFNSALRNQQLQQELKGRAAVGQAAQGALGPGGFDVGAFQNAIKQNPDAAWFALPALQEGQNNARSQLDRMIAQQEQIRQVIGALGDNPTKEAIYDAKLTLSRAGVPPADIMEALTSVVRSPGGAGAQYRNFGLTPAAQSQRGPMGPGVGGATTSGTLVEQNRAGTIATSLPAYAGPSIEAMQRDQQIQSGYANDIEPLRQSLDKIAELQKKYGAGFLGPGSKGRQELESTIFSYAPKFAKLLGVDPEKISDYAQLEKYLRAGTLTRASNYGAHSDQQLASAAAATPNVNVTDLAVPELLKVQYALRMSEYAQHQQAVARGGTAGEEYLNEKGRWPSRNDPRAFMMPLLSPEEQDKVMASLKKGSPEWQRFNNSLRAGYESGVLNRPGRATPAPTVAPPTAAPAAPAKPQPKPEKRSEAAPMVPRAANAEDFEFRGTPTRKSQIPTVPRLEYDQDNVAPGKQSAAPPMPGARLAADGHWYVRQPHANGDYQRVIMNA